MVRRLLRVFQLLAIAAALAVIAGADGLAAPRLAGAIAADAPKPSSAGPWHSLRLRPFAGSMPMNAGRRYVLRTRVTADARVTVSWHDDRTGRTRSRVLGPGCSLQRDGIARDAALVTCVLEKGSAATDYNPITAPFVLDLADGELRRIPVRRELLNLDFDRMGLHWLLASAGCDSAGCGSLLMDRHTGKRHAFPREPGESESGRRRWKCMEYDDDTDYYPAPDLNRRPLRWRTSLPCAPLRDGRSSVHLQHPDDGGALLVRRGGTATVIDRCRNGLFSICSDVTLRGGLVTWHRRLGTESPGSSAGPRGYDTRTGRRYRFRTLNGTVRYVMRIAFDGGWIYVEEEMRSGQKRPRIWRARWPPAR